MSRPERGRRQVGGWFPARRLKGVKGCPEGHGGALRGPGGLGEPCARGPERRWQRGARGRSIGSGGDSGRVVRAALHPVQAGLGAVRARARGAGRPPAWVSRSGERRGHGWRPAAGALTLLGLLLPRQRAAQLAEERFVLLHPVGPQGGRAQRRGGHGDARGPRWPGREQRVWEPPWSPPPPPPPARPGEWPGGRGPGAGPRPPPAPGPGGVRRPRSGSGSPRPACESHRRFPRAASRLLSKRSGGSPPKCRQSDRPRALCAPFVLFV